MDGHLQMQRANLPKSMCSQIFENVKQSVELDFNANMHRKGHMGSVRVDDEAGTLQLRVLISGATSNAAIVKDLKQLSGKLGTATRPGILVQALASFDTEQRCQLLLFSLFSLSLLLFIVILSFLEMS